MTTPQPDLTPAEHAERVRELVHWSQDDPMSPEDVAALESSLAALVEMATMENAACLESHRLDAEQMAEWKKRAEKAEAERDRMREALEMLQLAALKPETSKGEMLAFLDGVLEPHVHIVAKETK